MCPVLSFPEKGIGLLKEMFMRDSIVIIGGGLMGSGIAAVSALAGNPTIIVDVDRDKAKGGVTDALKCVRELCSNGLASDRSARQAEGLLEPEADMGAALEKANMVIEAVSENLELKQMVFKQMDELLPREIPITSNTSGLRISDIARYTKYPERTVFAPFPKTSSNMNLTEWTISTNILSEKNMYSQKLDMPEEASLVSHRLILNFNPSDPNTPKNRIPAPLSSIWNIRLNIGG